MKLSKHKRQLAAASKARRWDKIRVEMREYMRVYRATPTGKKVTTQARRAYMKRNADALAMYNQLVRFMYARECSV